MGLRAGAIRTVGRTHLAVYRLTRGRLVGRIANMPVLLLTTTGRRTGKARTTPLTFLEDGDDLVVVASNGGEDAPPCWWLNLRSKPRATVTIGDRSSAVEAREATSEERARLWPRIVTANPGYASYALRTKREIPIVLLGRAAGRD